MLMMMRNIYFSLSHARQLSANRAPPRNKQQQLSAPALLLEHELVCVVDWSTKKKKIIYKDATA